MLALNYLKVQHEKLRATDICHQVLDLYSATAPKKAEVSPPLTMPTSQPAQGQLSNVSNITTIGHQQTRQQPVQIQSESKPLAQQNSGSGKTVSNANSPSVGRKIEVTVDNKDRGKRQGAIEEKLPGSHQAQQPGQIVGRSEYSSYNPFISSQMYSSSFMSGEGAQSIQSIMMGGNNASAEGHPQQSTYVQQYTQQPAQAAYNYSSFAQGASGTTYTNQPVQPPYNTQYLSQQYLPQYSQPPAQYPQYPPTSQYPSPAFQQQQQQYQSSSSYSSYSAPQQSQTYNQPPTAQSYPRPTKHDRHEPSAPGLPTVRITSRPR